MEGKDCLPALECECIRVFTWICSGICFCSVQETQRFK